MDGGRTSFRMAEELGAGVAAIDRDHDEMMLLAQQLAKLHTQNDTGAVQKVLGVLLANAEAHWQREDEMLARYGYPGAAEHAHSHASARQLLLELIAAPPHPEAAFRAEDMLVRQLIADTKWKWWFLDAGLRPETC